METAADFAFTLFLAHVSPADFSTEEWDLFRWLRLRGVQ